MQHIRSREEVDPAELRLEAAVHDQARPLCRVQQPPTRWSPSIARPGIPSRKAPAEDGDAGPRVLRPPGAWSLRLVRFVAGPRYDLAVNGGDMQDTLQLDALLA